MSLLRELPPGTMHALSQTGMEFLPSFVRARLAYLADIHGWWSETVAEGEEEDETFFSYHEVSGMLSDGYYSHPAGDYVAPINFWIGSDDECDRSIHLGGSIGWICPSNKRIFFDSIDPQLLPSQPDLNVWWCISHTGIQVIKIFVNPPGTLTEHFPDEI
jgi:hypothetical protein